MTSVLQGLRRGARRLPLVQRAYAPVRRLRQATETYRLRKELEVYRSLCDLLASDPVVRFEEFGGTFSLDVRSHLFQRRLFHRSYEPRLAELARRFVDPSRDALDIGANVGFYSVLLAQAAPAQTVLAVEPNPVTVARLRSNLVRNSVADRVVVFEGAVSEESGTLSLRSVEGFEEYATLGAFSHPAMAGETPDETTVETVPLDTLVERFDLDPGFIKADIEGVEHLLLAGAGRVLRDTRPVFLTELSDVLLRSNGSSAGHVLGVFRDAGYRVYDAETMSLADEASPFAEVLCLPEEHTGHP